jgi:hypothetical protein
LVGSQSDPGPVPPVDPGPESSVSDVVEVAAEDDEPAVVEFVVVPEVGAESAVVEVVEPEAVDPSVCPTMSEAGLKHPTLRPKAAMTRRRTRR